MKRSDKIMARIRRAVLRDSPNWDWINILYDQYFLAVDLEDTEPGGGVAEGE